MQRLAHATNAVRHGGQLLLPCRMQLRAQGVGKERRLVGAGAAARDTAKARPPSSTRPRPAAPHQGVPGWWSPARRPPPAAPHLGVPQDGGHQRGAVHGGRGVVAADDGLQLALDALAHARRGRHNAQRACGGRGGGGGAAQGWLGAHLALGDALLCCPHVPPSWDSGAAGQPLLCCPHVPPS